MKSRAKEKIIFDITGIDPTLVNTLRHIMIAGVPTMTIETVIINHILGLIPILADANNFEEKKEDEYFNEKNCLKFNLKVK